MSTPAPSWHDPTVKLQWKVAIVTGSASGIGAHAARLFASEGATVMCVDVDQHGANAIANEITAAGGRAKAFSADVSLEDEIRAAVEFTVEEFGRLDVLFNNAGVTVAADGDAESTTMDTWDKTLAVNVKGVWLGCKYGIPAMRDTGGGSIINAAGFAAIAASAVPRLAYTASKGAVLSMTRELAVIHGRERIRVNALSPGPLRTGSFLDSLDGEDTAERYRRQVPMGRFGEAEEVARAALFLATDDSSYVTGAHLCVDGGISIASVPPT